MNTHTWEQIIESRDNHWLDIVAEINAEKDAEIAKLKAEILNLTDNLEELRGSQELKSNGNR